MCLDHLAPSNSIDLRRTLPADGLMLTSSPPIADAPALPTTDRCRAATVVAHWGLAGLFCLMHLAATNRCLANERGARLYEEHCASCHGSGGAGGEGFPRRLQGDLSLRELAEIIDRTMPEGEPEACTGEDARHVAEYMYDAFYSIIAQERLRPARIDLSRLTVVQHENALADLFNPDWPQLDRERGLKGEYFGRRGFQRDSKKFERLDAGVDFQFGGGQPQGFPPIAEGAKKESVMGPDPREFSIRWEGSLIAPRTGVYEIILETENGARVWLNDLSTPLIDLSVRSGTETRFPATIKLLGGRAYPLRVEYFRYQEDNCFVRLKWKAPRLGEELIPQRALSPKSVRPTFVVNTPFPPDDRSQGYERGAAVSPEWEAATVHAAIEAVAAAKQIHFPGASRRRDPEPITAEKAQATARMLVERAFRRPLNADEQQFFVDRHFSADADAEQAFEKAVLLALVSPRFLYLALPSQADAAPELAAWVSFACWDSAPDTDLLKAAREGKLTSESELRKQAQRLLAHPRARTKLLRFFDAWLQLDRAANVGKDSELFPGFDAALASDLQTSLDLWLEEFVQQPAPDYRDLWRSRDYYWNDRLAEFYGVTGPADVGFHKIELADGPRAGVLTHPLLLAAFAYDRTTSPIHRGVFLARSVLGRRLTPPPEAVTPDPPELHAGLTTRERIALQTEPDGCRNCHTLINPLGFSLEQFDAVGRYREMELGRAVDARGQYTSRAGDTVEFGTPPELAEFLCHSPEAREAFVEQLFQATLRQPVQAFGPQRLTELAEKFAADDYNIMMLLEEIVVTSALVVQQHPLAATQP